ncbi:MAG: SAM-dependent methyltransferase [Flavobacteriia bacterium]|nr:SAM-dependent methyltransferase [Flavobacteriia bacterium]
MDNQIEEALPSAPLYLIPSRIAETEPLEVLPLSIKKVVDSIDYYIVENEKTSREFIRKVYPPKSQPNMHFEIYNQYTERSEIPQLLKPCLEGYPVGLISDAGIPAVADPGADLVLEAHRMGIRVIPLIGPSSIILALMASGLNGNSFTFNGFLASESAPRKRKIQALEKKAIKGETQIIIESPLRNHKLLDDILSVCDDSTLLCIASSITSPHENISTRTIGEWRAEKPNIDKLPSIFLLGQQL